MQINAFGGFLVFHRDQIVAAQIVLQRARLLVQVHADPNPLLERHFLVFVDAGERANDLNLCIMDIRERQLLNPNGGRF